MQVFLRRFGLAIALFTFAVLTASHSLDGGVANAQDTVPAAGSLEGAVPGGTTEGSSSDAELWRVIRQGGQGTVVGQDKSAGVLIQSEGQSWREIRNGPLPRYTSWALLAILFLLSVFYALRGRIRISGGRTGMTITRFTLIERVGHWMLASSFIILAITGLNITLGKELILPLVGKETFGMITNAGKFVHNHVGFAFMVGVVMVAVMWIVHNIPNRHDIVWVLRGGGLLGGGHPPARKFNAGQKVIFWMVIVCGVSISLSGWALMNPFTTTMFAKTFAITNEWLGTGLPTQLSLIQEQQFQSIWHAIMAVIMIVVVIGHIYIGTIGMEGAADAMTTGEVDTNWAHDHHSLWVEEVQPRVNHPAE